jgi:hypothetical protein
MAEITTCSTSNCDNPATVKVADTSVPMLVCGACWHAMMMVETETTMGEADRAAARQLVKDWCDPKVPKGWEMREPGLIVRVGEAHGSFEYWVDVRDRYFRSHANTGRVPVEIVDIALRSIIAGMAPALAGTLTSALDDGDCLRGVIARAIRASDSIADNDAEDVIQEMLAILLEAEPEGRDDTVEWARMEGANAMLELIVSAGYGARGISDNRDGLRKAVAELAVAATMPRKPEPEFEAALLQREVEQLRAQLEEQREAADKRVADLAAEWRAEPDRLLVLLGERTRERDEAKHEANLLREQLDLVLRRLGWDGEATNECPYEHGDEVARALLEDREADARRAQSVIAPHSEETSVSERLIVTISASYIPDRGWEVRDNGGTKDVQWLSYAGATAELQKRADHYRSADRSVVVMRDGKEIAAMVIE